MLPRYGLVFTCIQFCLVLGCEPICEPTLPRNRTATIAIRLGRITNPVNAG